jgi:Protein of unknown function (DUF4435)
MTYLEELRQSKNKPQVAFNEFMLSTRAFSAHLFCFFEGKDNAYYVPRVKQFTAKYHPIKCGGREKVLAVQQLIANHTEYDRYKKAFFIDRDFNAPLQPAFSSIFETPCYSVENFYVSIVVFKEILTNEFHLSEVTDKVIFDNCLSIFSVRQAEFHQAICLFNAWYACLIDAKNATGAQTGVNLEDKLPKNFIEFTLKIVKSQYDLTTIQLLFPNATAIETDQLKTKLLLFQDCEQHKVFRGKYELQFLIELIRLLLKDAASPKIIFNTKTKLNFAFGDASSINNEQTINIFSGYAETPESLIEYLKKVTQ